MHRALRSPGRVLNTCGDPLATEAPDGTVAAGSGAAASKGKARAGEQQVKTPEQLARELLDDCGHFATPPADFPCQWCETKIATAASAIRYAINERIAAIANEANRTAGEAAATRCYESRAVLDARAAGLRRAAEIARGGR